MEAFRKEEFTFVFESRGTTFIFEDIVVSYYENRKSLTIWRDGVVSVFVDTKEFKKINEIGAGFTENDVRDKATTLDGLVRQINDELPALRGVENLTKEDVQRSFQMLAEICKAYHYFDIAYSDGLWEAAKTSKEAKKAADFVAGYKNVVREALNMPFFAEDGWLNTIIQKLSRQFSIPSETLVWHRERELIALFDGEPVNAEEIARRKKAYAFYVDEKNVSTLWSGDDAVQIAKSFLSFSSKSIQEIKGLIANSTQGKIRGRVRIIRRDYNDMSATRRDIEQMEIGEVFVSETTDPDLVEAMKKASAIVTDVGGMLSHAAITSRELGKPCIVGTEIASKVLKTGDLVEVDADEGVVRIIDEVRDGAE